MLTRAVASPHPPDGGLASPGSESSRLSPFQGIARPAAPPSHSASGDVNLSDSHAVFGLQVFPVGF
jgi:hypothetical protein